jgi:ABC-type nitrate/sulfonate/bicarbonate transport system permease component
VAARQQARSRLSPASDLAWRWGLRLATFGVLAAVWELSTRNLESLLIPTFFGTMRALGDLVARGTLWEPLWVSNQALVLGYLASVAIGLPLGLAMARARRVEKLVDPYLDIVMVTPMAALIPIFIMALGFGLAARAVVVFSFAFVMIAVNTRAGVRGVDPSLVEMARSFGATERQIWRRVLVPGALPGIMAGLRIGLGRAITGMVLVELLLVAVGIGKLLLDYRGLFNAEYLWAVVLAVLIEAVALMFLVRWLETRVLPWSESVAVD